MPEMRQDPDPTPRRSNAVKITAIIVGGLVVLGIALAALNPAPTTATSTSVAVTSGEAPPAADVPCLDTETGSRYSALATDALNEGSAAASNLDADGATTALHDASSNISKVADAMAADPAVADPLNSAAAEFELAATATADGNFTEASGYITAASRKIDTATAAIRVSTIPAC